MSVCVCVCVCMCVCVRARACAFRFNVALRPQRPYGPLLTGSPARPSRLSHSSFCIVRSVGNVYEGKNGTSGAFGAVLVAFKKGRRHIRYNTM